MAEIEINRQFEQVLNFVNRTGRLIFLTGKAGTGKTTLLRHIRKNTFKQMAVVAPTGVAAINAGGTTIHSLFQFAFAPFIPPMANEGDIQTVKQLPVLKYNSQRLALFRNLELLIIDEVSMLRADLLDQIDVTLRQVRRKWAQPFGGVQVLFIGDMYQLPPVVGAEEWSLLRERYAGPYFFDSMVIRSNPPVYIELEKIYRQTDDTFISLLNKVRNNQLSQKDLDQLNTHYRPEIGAEEYAHNITLTTHNRKADEINEKNLRDLPGKPVTFSCVVNGSFPEKSFPADEHLVLKKGARVMFLKNNAEKNYYNGKVGTVTQVSDDAVRVKCDEDREEITVQKESWSNVSYKVDSRTRQINEEHLGSFSQFPLRLAWAITIHKSQGLTFDRLIIDAADSFSAGQVYVALSRCRSLEGLTLSSRINGRSLINEQRIIGFSDMKAPEEQLNNLFNASQASYIGSVIINAYDLSELATLRDELAGCLMQQGSKFRSEAHAWSRSFFASVDTLKEVSSKFLSQIASIINSGNSDPEENAALQSRVISASVYFSKELQGLINALKAVPLVTESREAANEVNSLLQETYQYLFSREALISSFKEGFRFSDYIRHKLSPPATDFKVNVYASSKNVSVSAAVRHPALFKKLMLVRDEICNRDQKPIYMVANTKSLTEMSNYLPATAADLMMISGFGKAKADAYGEEFLSVVREYMEEHQLESTISEFPDKRSKKVKKEKAARNPTSASSYHLFKEGLSIDQIAAERNLTRETIEKHLIPYIANGELELSGLVNPGDQQLIVEALSGFKKEGGLTAVKNRLPEHISYSDIRFVMAGRLQTLVQ